MIPNIMQKMIPTMTPNITLKLGHERPRAATGDQGRPRATTGGYGRLRAATGSHGRTWRPRAATASHGRPRAATVGRPRADTGGTGGHGPPWAATGRLMGGVRPIASIQQHHAAGRRLRTCVFHIFVAQPGLTNGTAGILAATTD